MQRLVVHTATEQNPIFFLVIIIQDLFIFGMVIFRTCIAKCYNISHQEYVISGERLKEIPFVRLWRNPSVTLYRAKANTMSERKDSGTGKSLWLGGNIIANTTYSYTVLPEQSHLPCRKRNFLLNPEEHDYCFLTFQCRGIRPYLKKGYRLIKEEEKLKLHHYS